MCELGAQANHDPNIHLHPWLVKLELFLNSRLNGKVLSFISYITCSQLCLLN